MKWEDYKPIRHPPDKYKRISVECPKCGKYIYKNIQGVYLLFSLKYKYFCMNCGWWSFK